MQLLVNEEPVLEMKSMSEEEFFELCSLNPDRRLERTSQGDILIMPPTGLETSSRNSDLNEQLRRWTTRDGRGVAFDSNAGFTLPNGAILSPDASWVLRSKLAALTREQKRRFPPLCPDFVVELTSPTDRLEKVRNKMEEWIANGAGMGWLLDADKRQVYIYRPQGIETIGNPRQLTGDGIIQGFVLDLSTIWEPGW